MVHMIKYPLNTNPYMKENKKLSQYGLNPIQTSPVNTYKPEPSIGSQIASSMPKNTYTGYSSPYASQIQELVKAYQSRPQFNYDMQNDPVAQKSMQDAANTVSRVAARKNMLYSAGAKQNMSNAALQQGVQLQNNAYERYNQEGNNMLNQLQMLVNLDRNVISDQRYNQEYADAQQQQKVNNAINQSNVTGYYNPYAGVQISPDVQQYSQDYQAEINKRRATPDTADDTLIPQLEAARAQKIFNSPDLLAMYGQPYMTEQSKANALSQQLKTQELELESDPNNPENQKKMLELQKIAYELQNLEQYGPREQELKLQEIQSRINENSASASASRALADQRKKSGTNSENEALTYKQYIDMGKDMLNAGKYDDDNNFVQRYTPDDVINWVLDTQMSNDENENDALQEKLIKELGLLGEAKIKLAKENGITPATMLEDIRKTVMR